MEFLHDLLVGTFSLITWFVLGVISLVAIVYIVLDAKRRGKSGCLALLLAILLPFPINLILWLLVRPKGSYGPLF